MTPRPPIPPVDANPYDTDPPNAGLAPRDVLRQPGGIDRVLAAFAAEAAELGLADLGAGTAAELATRLAADDPIVAEVRAAREALFAAAGYDLEEFGRQIRASEAAAGRTSVVRPPRAP